MRVEPMLQPGVALVVEAERARDAILDRLARAALPHTPGLAIEPLFEALVDRESKFPTGTPEGVAFPHALMPEISRTFVIPALLRPGVRWSDQNHPPQDIVFAIFGSADTPWEHVRLLARLARIVRRDEGLANLRAATDPADLLNRLIQEDRLHG
jgi:PTS system nitrogen regulatory IIA component